MKGVIIMRNVMKLFLILTAMIVTFSSISCEAAKKTVAVMPLENVSGYTEARVAEIMTEELTSALYQSGRYTVIERNQMATVLKETGFQMTGAVDPNKAVEAGKLLGAQYVVIGKVTMAGVDTNSSGNLANSVLGIKAVGTLKGKIGLNYRFIDVQTGEIKSMGEAEGSEPGNTRENAIYKACKEAAQNVLKDMVVNVKARVADMSGDDIYIDAGKEGGFKVGENLEIVRETAPIEINGKIVGMKEVNVGTAKVTEVNDEYSVCKVTSHSDTVKKGDVVKRAQKKK